MCSSDLRYIDADAFLEKFKGALENAQHYGLYNHAKITQYVMKSIENEHTADVVPMAEVKKMQECIYDIYVMLDKIIESAKRHDLSMLRPFRGASGCDAYQGLPPICRSFDALFDKHGEAIHGAANYVELKKKYDCKDTN